MRLFEALQQSDDDVPFGNSVCIDRIHINKSFVAIGGYWFDHKDHRRTKHEEREEIMVAASLCCVDNHTIMKV